MICFTTHNYIFFKRKEIWFYNKEYLKPVGYDVFAYTLETDIPENALIEWTSHIDLTKTEEQLFKAISSTFRCHINRALHLGVQTEINFTPTVYECKRIIKELVRFAKLKGFYFNKRRLRSLQKKGNLCVSNAKINNTNNVTHVYLFDNKRIALLHTFHDLKFRDDKMRSYANKLLHWQEILEFKHRHFELYDWGGVNPENLPGITQFKLSFGGTTVKCYSYIKIAPVLKIFFKWYKNIRK